MRELPAYQPLFERLLDFATAPRFERELLSARTEFFSLTGDVFDEDRSFEVRMQAFLDWYVFDRRLESFGEPPARAYCLEGHCNPAESQAFRVLARTVHGVFEVLGGTHEEVELGNLLTGAKYRVHLPSPLAGVARGELFEARLVPFEERYHFSSAFLFHPPHIRRRLLRELRRERKAGESGPVQAMLFTLSRMASRAEHYRNVDIDAIYDFSRPPPVVAASRMKFDRLSVERRLGRAIHDK